MCNQEEEVKVNPETSNEELRTRRAEAKAEMLQSLPALVSSLSPIVDALAKVEISRHETLGSRLIDSEIDRAQRGSDLFERLVDLGREFHIFHNIGRMVESDCNLEIAENEKTIRDLESSSPRPVPEVKRPVKRGRKAKK